MLDFQRNIREFEKKDIQVIGASADNWAEALQTVENYRLTFKIGYDLSPQKISALTGAFYNEKGNYLHATGFIIDSEQKIENAGLQQQVHRKAACQ